RSYHGRILRQPVGSGRGVVAVHDRRGRGADQQSCRASAAARGLVAEECIRLSQRRGLPVRGAYLDGGADAASATTQRAELPVRNVACSSRWDQDTRVSTGVMNGYKLAFRFKAESQPSNDRAEETERSTRMSSFLTVRRP